MMDLLSFCLISFFAGMTVAFFRMRQDIKEEIDYSDFLERRIGEQDKDLQESIDEINRQDEEIEHLEKRYAKVIQIVRRGDSWKLR